MYHTDIYKNANNILTKTLELSITNEIYKAKIIPNSTQLLPLGPMAAFIWFLLYPAAGTAW